jgi:hypothetical protein
LRLSLPRKTTSYAGAFIEEKASFRSLSFFGFPLRSVSSVKKGKWTPAFCLQKSILRLGLIPYIQFLKGGGGPFTQSDVQRLLAEIG